MLANFPKLSESFILNELLALRALGVEVEVAAFADPSERHRREGAARIPVHYVPPPRSWALLRHPAALATTLRLPGNLRHRSIAVVRAHQLLALIRTWATPPDRLHAHFADGPSVVALLAARALGRPCSLTAHSVDLFCNPDPALLQLVLEGVDVVVVPAQGSKEHLVARHRLTPQRIAVVRAVADPSLYPQRPTPAVARATPGPTALLAARLVDKKGARFAIEAMAQLAERRPTLRLDIVGEGPLEAQLRHQAQALGLEQRVRFLGAIPDAQLHQALREADLFVLPCIITPDGDRDICPLTLQEAMLVGVPVIAGRAGSTEELVIDGRTGRLVAGDDPAAIAAAIDAVLGDPAATAAMVEAAGEFVRQEFDPRRNALRLLQAWGVGPDQVREESARS